MIPTVQKALIIRFSSIGDILLATPLIRRFRARFPKCQLDFIVKDTFADLLSHNPHLSNVIPFPAGGSLDDLKKLRATIHETGYDVVMDIHDSLRSRFLTFGLKHTVRINKRKLARFILVKFGVNLYEYLGGSPGVAERYLETVEHLGVEDDDNGLEVFISEDDKIRAESLLGNPNRPMVGIAPGAVHWNKTWPTDRFAQAAILLATDLHSGVLLFGSPKEVEQCGIIEDFIRTKNPEIPVCNTAGVTTLLEAAALLDHCSLVLTNDSGLMHLAAARKRKVVAVFGPTVEEFGFFPFGTESIVIENDVLSCRPCTHVGLNHCPKKHFRCMKEIRPDRVLAASRNLLSL